MDLWLLEELRQRRCAARRRPVCLCCGENVATERYLDLSPLGVEGEACERCVERLMCYCALFEQEVCS